MLSGEAVSRRLGLRPSDTKEYLRSRPCRYSGMSINSLQVPFGLRDGRLYEPLQVESGLKCACSCPGCGAPLVARHSPSGKVVSHFAHQPGADCATGFETANDTIIETYSPTDTFAIGMKAIKYPSRGTSADMVLSVVCKIKYGESDDKWEGDLEVCAKREIDHYEAFAPYFRSSLSS